jgi:hypothetical protein
MAAGGVDAGNVAETELEMDGRRHLDYLFDLVVTQGGGEPRTAAEPVAPLEDLAMAEMSQAARRPAQSTTSYPLARPRSAISPSSASVSRAVPLPWLTRCTGTVRLALSAMTALMASGPSTEGISTRQAEPSA